MQSLATTRPKRRTARWIFRVIYLSIIISGTIAYLHFRGVSASYDATLQAQASTPLIAGTIELGDTTVVIPSKSFIEEDALWSLVSKKYPLGGSFGVSDLVASPIKTGGNEQLQVAKRIVAQLSALVAAAKVDGHELMLSSAYRSVADQQATFDTFVTRYGKEMAGDYVSPPGSSEHHTGLAVDFSDASDACRQDSEQCSLGMVSAAWLVDNAPDYGFMLRYPEGKKSITGVGYEWWHFRYVGVTLAKAITSSDLTLDEAVEKIRDIAKE